MQPVYQVLQRASLQLYADGHNGLAADIKQLANKWTPAEYEEMVEDTTPQPTMQKQPTDYQLMQLYRDWWEASYGKSPNSQATIIAAAFGRHVLDTYLKDDGDQ